jgi:hypothetical protein
MNAKQIVRLSNIIGITSIILLVYWVFTFILIQVFGLKVFRENMTETFYLSVLGILALMVGSLIINLMFNLTRIAEKHNQDDILSPSNKKKIILLLFIFPLISIILFGGDYLTSNKKEKLLIASAKSVVEENKINSDKLVDYKFSKKYITETSAILDILSETDTNFPSVTLIVKDTLNGSAVFLGFTQHSDRDLNDSIAPQKKNFLYQTTKEERDYLNKALNNSDALRYNSKNGNYELFYPYNKGTKRIVLYFSEQQRYGKIGS